MILFFRLIRVLVIAITIPAIGILTYWYIMPELQGKLNVENEILGLRILLGVSILAAGIGIFIPISYWWASIYAGQNRNKIASVFPTMLRSSIVLIALTVFMQGAILTYSAYIAEYVLLGQVHIIIIGLVGLGALIGGFGLIKTSWGLGRNLEMNVLGKLLKQSDAPNLFGFVHYLANRLGARPPDNIVVGLEPTFYVTSGQVHVASEEKPVRGETLYLSAPLCRLLSQEELASVVGHELGHFRGDDTVYSMKFAPVYAGLGQAIHAVSAGNDDFLMVLARLPAMSMLSFMHRVFAINEAKISRDREFHADKAGAFVGSPFALSVALVKTSLYSGIWEHAREHNIHRLNEGKVADNLSVVFQDIAKYDVEHDSLENIMKTSLQQIISHPTDTHPPTLHRMQSLGIDPQHITKNMLLVPQQPAINLIDNYTAIEEEVTMQEHHLMVAVGAANPPEHDEENVNQLLYATYSLAAAMVCADGYIDHNEINVAEGIGYQMFEDFDPVEFRAYCNNPKDIPEPVELSNAMREALEQEDREMIMRYLQEISKADGNVSHQEIALMQRISHGLGVSYPVPDPV